MEVRGVHLNGVCKLLDQSLSMYLSKQAHHPRTYSAGCHRTPGCLASLSVDPKNIMQATQGNALAHAAHTKSEHSRELSLRMSHCLKVASETPSFPIVTKQSH